MIERIIKSVFKKERRDMTHKCPDPEILAAYIDNLLTAKEKEKVERHLVDCDLCLDGVILSKTMEAEQDACKTSEEVVDVVVRFLKHVVKVISKVNEVRVLPELSPVPLRGKKDISRHNARFSREFEEFTAEVEIERQDENIGDIRIKTIKDDHPIDNIRVTLLKDDKELISYLTEEGRVVFEDVSFDKYEIRFTQKGVFKGEILLRIKNG